MYLTENPFVVVRSLFINVIQQNIIPLMFIITDDSPHSSQIRAVLSISINRNVKLQTNLSRKNKTSISYILYSQTSNKSNN